LEAFGLFKSLLTVLNPGGRGGDMKKREKPFASLSESPKRGIGRIIGKYGISGIYGGTMTNSEGPRTHWGEEKTCWGGLVKKRS